MPRSRDGTILANVQLIRFHYENRKIQRVIWIPGKLNLADPLTKKDCLLTDALQLTLFEGRLPFDFINSKMRYSTACLG